MELFQGFNVTNVGVRANVEKYYLHLKISKTMHFTSEMLNKRGSNQSTASENSTN